MEHEYQNLSDKVITGVIFQVSLRNVIGEEMPYKEIPTTDYDSLLGKKPETLQPQAVKKAYLSSGVNIDPGVFLYVYGVRFEDGTIWKDSGGIIHVALVIGTAKARSSAYRGTVGLLRRNPTITPHQGFLSVIQVASHAR